MVAIISQQGNQAGACSGTIVKKEGRIAWVLTAAHCVEIPPTIVFMGADYNSTSAKRYDILDYAAHPSYNGQVGSPADVAMIRMIGASAQTPVIPITDAADQLTIGTTLTSVGYGRTTPASASGGDNSVRKNIRLAIRELSTTHVGYQYTNGNICQGDSGGPALRGTGTTERVVGVHSYVTGDCTQQAYSVRISQASNYQFIQAQLAKAVPGDSCDLCTRSENSGDNRCAAKQSECYADKDCAGYADCRGKCSTAACQLACDDKFPRALAKFNAAAYCFCEAASCKTLCTSECRGAPQCGITLPRDACGTCSATGCCDAVAACAADTDCYLCLKNGASADASCATNRLRKTVADCAATKCKTECAADPIGQGGEPAPGTPGAPTPGEGGGTTTTTTTTGCAVAQGPSSDFSGLAGLAGIAAVLGLAARRRARHDADLEG